MLLKEVLEIYDLLDRPGKPAKLVKYLFKDLNAKVQIKEVKGKKGTTDFIKIIVPGKKGKSIKGNMPTLGVVGRLGGVGARPEVLGMVSDGDGALTALSTALRLARMNTNGDVFEGDVMITTHICTTAPTRAHNPVPFMDSPVSLGIMNKQEVSDEMDAILSIDTSRGNRIINTTSYAISPPVKEGWILRISEDLLDVMQYTTGEMPYVLPITMQDITPYENGVFHFNSIMLPATTTEAPVVGVAITSKTPVPGCYTGVSNAHQIDKVGRFVIEVAQHFTANKLSFYDNKDFATLKKLYGKMSHLYTVPKK